MSSPNINGSALQLSKWSTRYFILPLSIALIAQLIFISLAISRSIEANEAAQESALKQISVIIAIALEQKNRVMIEASLNAVKSAIDADSINLCKLDQSVINVGAINNACSTRQFSDKASARIEIPGFSDYCLAVSKRNYFGSKTLNVFLFSLIGFAIAALWLHHQIRVRFRDDIVTPLSSALTKNSELKISELVELKRRQEMLAKIELDAAVAHALVLHNKQIAHDIRAPLSVLNLILSQPQNVPEESKQLIEMVSRRINAIANQLLVNESSTSTTDTRSPVNQNKDCNTHFVKLLEQIILEQRAINSPHNSKSLTFEVLSPEIRNLRADPIDFGRAVTNLISNALDAVDENSGRVLISVEQKNESALIAVTDNGYGIPQDLIPKLGNAGVTFGKKNGTGYGLSQVKSFTENNNGHFGIESIVGSGTKVWMILPIVTNEE